MNGYLHRLLEGSARTVGQARSMSGAPAGIQAADSDPLEQIVDVPTAGDASSAASTPALSPPQANPGLPEGSARRVAPEAAPEPGADRQLPLSLRDAGFRSPGTATSRAVPRPDAEQALTAAVTRVAPDTPDARERWRELHTRLLAVHPPAYRPDLGEAEKVDARRLPEVARPAIVQAMSASAREQSDHDTRSHRLARTSTLPAPVPHEPPATTHARPITEPRGSDSSDLVIQHLDVRIVSNGQEPHWPLPRHDRPRPEPAGAWTVAARRYLGRV